MSRHPDLSPLFLSSQEPSPRSVRTIDGLSWILPLLAAGLSVGAGVAAWLGDAHVAAGCGVMGGFFSAVGVLFTGWASRIRDGRLGYIRALSEFGIAQTQDHSPLWSSSGFGS